MYLPQTDTELRNALMDAADLAVKAFAAETGAIKAGHDYAEMEGKDVSLEAVLPKRKLKPITK